MLREMPPGEIGYKILSFCMRTTIMGALPFITMKLSCHTAATSSTSARAPPSWVPSLKCATVLLLRLFCHIARSCCALLTDFERILHQPGLFYLCTARAWQCHAHSCLRSFVTPLLSMLCRLCLCQIVPPAVEASDSSLNMLCRLCIYHLLLPGLLRRCALGRFHPGRPAAERVGARTLPGHAEHAAGHLPGLHHAAHLLPNCSCCQGAAPYPNPAKS